MKTKNKWVPYLFMAPALIILGVFVIYPIVYSIPLSFMEYSVIGTTKFVGLSNFKMAMSDSDFWIAMKNSIIFVGMVIPLQLIAIIIANLVNKKLKGIVIFRILYYIPVVTSMVAVGIIWKFLLDPTGFINTVLKSLGFTKDVIYFLDDKRLALFVLMLITIWQGIGYYMMMYLGGLQNISDELIEAARLDGAKEWKILFKIKIPLLKPYIWICSLTSLIAALGVFDIVFTMTKGGPDKSTLVMNYYSYNVGFQNFNFGYASALGLILSVVVLLFSIVLFIYQRRGGMTNEE